MNKANTSLQHWGIMGMKWGVRRAGSRQAGPPSADWQKVSGLKKKRISEMSNEELKALTSRMQLEKQYKDLKKQDHSAGAKFVNEMLTNAGSQLINTLVSKAVTVGSEKLIKYIMSSRGG